MEEQNEPRPSRLDPWRARARRLRAATAKLAPFAAGIACAFVALLLYNLLLPAAAPLNSGDVNKIVSKAMASATPRPPDSALVFQAVAPSLVQIETQILGTDGKKEGSLGAGVVIDDQGDILTALHVVDQAIAIQVTFADGSTAAANVVNKVAASDIAVLRAGALPANIAPATLGNPGDLHIGDEAFALGSPFGLSDTLTAGVVSGLNRSFKPKSNGNQLQGLIQFDAAVNPGNSGGPLVNRNGEVVGVVTGLANPTDQDVFIGIGFAVPIDVAASGAGSPPY